MPVAVVASSQVVVTALVWATDRPAPGLEVAAGRAGVAVYVTTAAWPVVSHRGRSSAASAPRLTM